MPFTRRELLGRGAVLGAGLMLPFRWGVDGARAATALAGSSLARFVDPLPVPPFLPASWLAANGLTMAEATHRFHRDLGETPTWGYAGASYLGPTFEARRGKPVTFEARNSLGPHLLGIDRELHGPTPEDVHAPRVSVHLHGGYTEERSDGYPEATFRPGESRTYTYANEQQAGTTWFHDHALGITRLNVYAGLAAFYLMRDPAHEGGLPVGAPFEVPLAIQDKSFLDGGDGTSPLLYPDPWEPEFFGDVPVVNGKAWPNLDVARGWYRFRMLNGSSSRIYHLSLVSDGGAVLPLVQIGTDTGFVAAPVPLESLVLAPGERADVMVDFSVLGAGATARLLNLELPEFVVSPAGIEIPELMQFTVTSARGWQKGPSAKLRPSDPFLPPAGPIAQTRNVLLTEIMDHEGEAPLMALLNARQWHTTDVELPRVDTIERWNILNLTADTHPIHLHLVQFVCTGRQPFDAEAYLRDVLGTDDLGMHDVIGDRGEEPGLAFPPADAYVTGEPEAPAPYEVGWKDTIQAHPGTVTSILVPFGPNAARGVPFGSRRQAPFTGEYVWHCHILDHEDNEMMLPYRVMP
jgi:spore coat protein A